MTDPPEDMAARLAQALSAHWETKVTVDSLHRFHGQTARETWGFVAHLAGKDRHGPRHLVLRRDPLIAQAPTSRSAEFHAITRAHAAGLPVPEPILLDLDGRHLGAPGFIMQQVRGGRAPALLEEAPYGSTASFTGQALFHALGALHRLPLDDRDRAALPVMDVAARLQYFASLIRTCAAQPEPVADAALRWLWARVPPPSGPLALVHGDFRSGNFLVDPGGRLLAVLDWELAHIGDPMEDLAWAMDPLWSHGRRDLASATLPPAEMFEIWEAASGRRVALEHLDWWRMFSGVKGLALWIADGRAVRNHQTIDPVMTFSSLYSYRFHNAEVAQMLYALSA